MKAVGTKKLVRKGGSVFNFLPDFERIATPCGKGVKMVPIKGIYLALLVLVASSSFYSSHVKGDKYEDDDDYYDSRERVLETSYHGLIKENETFVEITPLIKVDETKICGFHIIKKNKEIPFQIELVNELGILKAKKSLNCEKRKNYKFDITAVFCDGSHSKSASVHISVIDINEYSPTFLQPSYVTELNEYIKNFKLWKIDCIF